MCKIIIYFAAGVPQRKNGHSPKFYGGIDP